MTFGDAEKNTNLLKRPKSCSPECIHFYTGYCPKHCSLLIAQQREEKRINEERLK